MDLVDESFFVEMVAKEKTNQASVYPLMIRMSLYTIERVRRGLPGLDFERNEPE